MSSVCFSHRASDHCFVLFDVNLLAFANSCAINHLTHVKKSTMYFFRVCVCRRAETWRKASHLVVSKTNIFTMDWLWLIFVYSFLLKEKNVWVFFNKNTRAVCTLTTYEIANWKVNPLGDICIWINKLCNNISTAATQKLR